MELDVARERLRLVMATIGWTRVKWLACAATMGLGLFPVGTAVGGTVLLFLGIGVLESKLFVREQINLHVTWWLTQRPPWE